MEKLYQTLALEELTTISGGNQVVDTVLCVGSHIFDSKLGKRWFCKPTIPTPKV